MMNRILRTTCGPVITAAFLAPAQLGAQQAPLVPPSVLHQPLAGDWPVYSGDYTGQRYSLLTQVNVDNVKHLTLAWIARMNTSTTGAIVGGEGKGDFPVASRSS